MSTTKTGKCQHDFLIVHRINYEFFAQCSDCGMIGPVQSTPASARESFNRRKGSRDHSED